MSKRHIPQKPIKQVKATVNSFKTVSTVILLLYVLLQLLPRLQALDVMGSHWLFLSVLNCSATLYLFLKKKILPNKFFKTMFILLYFVFLIFSLLSFIVAFNVNESMVAYSRLLISVIAFLNITTILFHNRGILKILFILLGLLVLFQSVYVIITFLSNYNSSATLDEVVFLITGNSGHKNILAASIAIKIPFLIYLIHTSKLYARLLFLFTLLLACIALFMINARAAYLALFLEMILYSVVIFFQFFKSGRSLKSLLNPSFVIGIFIVSVVVSQIALTSLSKHKDKKFYGTITSRIESIGFSETGSSKRSLIWNSAIDFIKKHPFTGGGYGNWKINSIPYETTFQPGFGIAKHAHNDFLEIAADTGIPGALIYLALFVCLGFYALKIIASKSASMDTKMMITAAALALSAYFIDSLFNFPLERPNIQILFAFIAAIIVVLYFENTQQEDNHYGITKKVVWTTIFLSLMTVFISYEVFKSMQVQYDVSDVWLDTNKQEWFKNQKAQLPFKADEINAQFPAIPNISEYGMPIACMKAKFLFDEQRFDEALATLDGDKNSNPNLFYAEYLKGLIADKKNQPDTAMKYAETIFYRRPGNINFYYLIEGLAFERKDTMAMNRAFKTFISYNYSHQVWADYSQNLFTVTNNPLTALAIVEDGLGRYPADSALLFKKNFYNGVSNYMQNKFPIAIKFFMEGLKYKDDNLSKENIAFAWFNQGMYVEALHHFNTLVGKVSSGGKLEFFRGICYKELHKKEEACKDLLQAHSLGYSMDGSLLKDCK